MAKRKDPSLEDGLAALPRWAGVALAARCARRIQPLFAAAWPGVTLNRVARVDRGITVAEQAAAKGGAAAVPRTAGDSANSVSYCASEAEDAGKADAVAPVLAWAATYAALAAAEMEGSRRTSWVSNAVAYGHLWPAGPKLSKVLRQEITRDWERLRDAFRREAWTDETPVPPDFFGPLWAAGEPAVWDQFLRKLQQPSPAKGKKGKPAPATKKPPVGPLRYEPDSFAGPLDRAHVAAVGASLGRRFDPDYLRHLARYHGGVPGKRFFPTANNVKVIERFLCMIPDPVADERHGWHDVEVVFDQLEDRLGDDEETYLVPFAALFGGDFLCFDYRSGDPPRVVAWDHEASEPGKPATEEVAAGFAEFLKTLRDDEGVPPEAPRRKARPGK
jgi:hypothetical protein